MPWVIVGYKRDPDGGGMIPIRRWEEPAKKRTPSKRRATSSSRRRASSSSQRAANRRRRQAELERRRRAREAARRQADARRRRAVARAKRRAAERAREVAQRERERAGQRANQVREQQQLQVEKGRRRAYENLQARAAESVRRARMVKDKNERLPKVPTARQEQIALGRRRTNRVEETERQAAVIQSQVRLREAEDRKRYVKAFEYQKKKRQALGEQVRVPGTNRMTGTPATKFDPKLAEEILAEEARRAGRGNFDTEAVKRLTEKYVAHADRVQKDYNKAADKLQAQIDRINAALRAGNVEQAQKHYQKYLKLLKQEGKTLREYDRMFGGAGSQPGSGAFNQFFSSYSAIEKGQTEWWKRQMQSTLDADRSEVNRLLKDAIARGDAEAIRQYNELSQVYEGNTGFTYDPKLKRRRRRTIEEELDYREAQRRIEMERLRAQYTAEQRRIQLFARKEGLVQGLAGRYVSPEVADVERQILESFPNGELGPMKRAQDIQGAADTIVADWERSELKRRGIDMGDVHRYGSEENKRAYGQFLADRKRFEKQVYEYFGNGVPEWWDRAFAAPGISHGLAFLQAIPSIFGVGARAGLGAATGTTTLDIGPTMDQAPPEVRRELAKLPPDGSAGSPRMRYFLEWLSTPAGQAWREKRSAELRESSAAADARFHQALGGDSADILDAINSYGAEPTSHGAVNLMIQLLADPTNAIPLKFTTYLARAKFAADQAAQATSKVSKTRMALRGFAAEESKVRAFNEFRKTALEIGGDPVKLRHAIDEIGLELANVKNKSALDKLVQEKLRAAGLSRVQVDAVVQRNVIESMIGARIVSRAERLRTQADEAAAEIKRKAAEKKAGLRKRNLDRRKRDLQVKHGLETRARAGVQAQSRLARARDQEIARLAAAKPRPVTPARRAAPHPVLRGIERATPGSRAPRDWTEGQALRAVDSAFTGKPTARATQVFDYATSQAGGRVSRRVVDRLWDRVGRASGRNGAVKRADVEDAYWRGEITHRNPEGHTLAWLVGVGDRPQIWERTSMAYIRHMDGIGQGEQARRMVAEAFADSRRRFIARQAASGEDAAKLGDDAVSSAEEELWAAVGVKADVEKARAFAEDVNGRPSEQPAAVSPDSRAAGGAEDAGALGEESAQAWAGVASPIPVETQIQLALNAEAIKALTGMTEDQWWNHLAAKARAVLKSKTTSVRAKAQARAALDDIRLARYAKAQARKSDSYVSPEARSRHAARVVALEGQAAEELIAPRVIAPLAEDAQALAVEQTRTLWRLLRSASDEVADSRVKGIYHKGELVDHMPKRVFEQADEFVSDEIAKLRGRRADIRSRGRTQAFSDAAEALGKYSDRDPKIVKAKQRALRRLAEKTGWKIDVRAYDEARRALWKGHVQNRSALWLMAEARKMPGDFVENFKSLRAKEAKAEARRQLFRLAYGEMFGQEPGAVIAEFTARYTDDGTLKSFTPELTAFQRRTLEENVKTLSGVKDLDETKMGFWLRSRNAPSFASREEGREFLKHIGAWSPRTAEDITVGKRSWSIDEEARYWRDSYGWVPAWADRHLLGGDLKHIFHDQELYFDQMRKWGVFNRSMEWQLRLTGESAEDIEKQLLEHGQRELALQRRYVIERYGDLVSKDGETLDAIPWLMTPQEQRVYIRRRMLDGSGLSDSIFHSEDELTEFMDQTSDLMDDLWDKYMVKAPGEDFVFDDIFHFASEIQARILANPTWSRRYRDVFGDALNAWAHVSRAMVFTQFSFMAMNVIDVPIKTGWYRWTNRWMFSPKLVGDGEEVLRKFGITAEELAEESAKWSPQDLGIDLVTTLYRYKQRPLADILTNPVSRGSLNRALERVSVVPRAAYRAAPHWAGRAEIFGKMNMARQMYPQVYADALRQLGDPELAKVAARRFIKREIGRMWPTVGDSALEKLFNELVPFGSYMVRNKVLFLSEAIGHPSILNKIAFLSAVVEEHNRAEWEKKNPGVPLEDQFATRIELPWAPGFYLDVGQFTDATRGLKPLFKAQGSQTYLDFVSQWVRIVNPGTEAGILMLTNALGVTQRVQWRPIYKGDFLVGYEKVVTGWTEPWSKDQPSLSSVLHFVDAWESIGEYFKGGLSNGELSQIIGKVALFDAISTPNRGAGLFELYKTLRERDEAAAEKWLTSTADGKYLQDWLLTKQTELRDVADWFSLNHDRDVDPKRWFHTQSVDFQEAVTGGYDLMSKIEAAFEAELADAKTPEESRRIKQEMLLAISEVYRLRPELVVFEVYSKSASEWSRQLQRWQVNQKLDEFFALDEQRPQRQDFKTSEAYNDAVEAWRHQKQVFLETYPGVKLALAGGRTQLMAVKDKVEAEWARVFSRIEKRNEAIEAAKASGKDILADMLYLQNDLDYGRLRADRVSLDWDESDYATLPKGMIGPPGLRDGALAKATEIFDLDRRSYAKAVKEGRGQQWLDDRFYVNGMKEIIQKAKGGSPFGEFDPAKFVAEMRKRPKLMKMYFAKHPGKQKKWAENEAYVKAIGRWGRAIGASNFDLAERIWSQLPEWVRLRYLRTHPRSKMRLDGGFGGGGIQYGGQFFKSIESRDRYIRGAQYLGWVQRWVKYFERDDVAGGMKFFWSMPKWVREQYFSKHPEKRAKWEAQLKYGAQLGEYFAMDEAGRADYLKSHKELQEFLAKNVSGKEARRAAILAGYRELPNDPWLKRVYREKYPEVFSKEAQGERRLQKVYDRLASHPEMLPSFEKWVEAIWETYTEMLKHVGARPRALKVDHEPIRRRVSLSAEELRRLEKLIAI